MDHKQAYDNLCLRISRLTTQAYSTSFSLGIRCFDRRLRAPIYSIYGFVRFADEIVDTFHGFDKKNLLARFEDETWKALEERISLNPILNSFQETVHQFRIEHELITGFLTSMAMDLERKTHDRKSLDNYVFGSAEAVGLMCLRVFCQRDKEYEALKTPAMKLGSAFQKVNFLRDLRDDYSVLGRIYFPDVDINQFDEVSKKKIEDDIAEDFRIGYSGIRKLPRGARLGVYVAYLYYQALFKKIKNLPSSEILKGRIRVKNRHKLAILGYSFIRHQFNLI